jgi:hypothetical protein
MVTFVRPAMRSCDGPACGRRLGGRRVSPGEYWGCCSMPETLGGPVAPGGVGMNLISSSASSSGQKA